MLELKKGLAPSCLLSVLLVVVSQQRSVTLAEAKVSVSC